MDKCQCYVKKTNLPCNNKKKKDSLYCGIHKNCKYPINKFTPQQFSKKMKQQKYDHIKKIFQQAPKLTKSERQDIYSVCGKKCCPLDTNECKYSICKDNTCQPHCPKILEAILKKNFARKNQKNPNVQKYKMLSEYLTTAYKENNCSKKK
jgi:hypothetical protein